VGLVGFGLGASRFLPVLDQLHAHTRQLSDEHDAASWQTLRAIFLARDHGRDMPGQDYVWTEFGDYVGPIVLLLSIVGVLTCALESPWLLFLLGATFVLMLGHFASWAPASILKAHVYPFKQMRVPSRLNAWVTVFLAAYAGLGVDRLSALASRFARSPRVAQAARTAIVAIALVGAGDIISVGITFGAQFFTSAAQNPRTKPSARLYLGGKDLAEFIDQPTQHRGRLECWEEWGFEAGAPLWSDDVPQARAVDSLAIVDSVTRTQNSFAAHVRASAPTLILLNSGYDRGFQTNVGAVVRSGKQLAVEIPAGEYDLRVKYWPHGLTLGFILTGLTLLGIAGYFVRSGRRATNLQRTPKG